MLNLPLDKRTAGVICAHAATLYGDRPFVEMAGHSVSFRAADRRSNRVANAFAALGVGKDIRVAILLSNRLEYLDLWFGLAKIGAIELPINTGFRSKQIRHVLTREEVPVIVVELALVDELLPVLPDLSGCRAIIFVDGSPQDSRKLSAPCFRYEDLLAEASEEAPRSGDVSGADIAAIMNTSGTTGPPKGVLLPHGQQYWLARNMALAMQLTDADAYYNFFPLFHNTAQAMITLPVMLTGGRMVLRKKFSLSSFWEDVRSRGITAFYFIGEMLRLLVLETTPEDARGSYLRVGWGIGGSAEDCAEFEKRFGVQLGTCYGSTEANVPVFRLLGVKQGGVGRVLPEFEIRIADSFDRQLPPGQIGEILVRSKEPYTLMAGYDGNPAATIEAMRNQWVHTGDTGYVDEKEDYFFSGRVRDVIRVRGENASAFEIEEAVATHPQVREVAAIAVPGVLGGDEIKVVLVVRDSSHFDYSGLIAHCERLLPKYAVPRYIELVEELPKTETNKMKKYMLRETPFTERTWDRLVDAHSGNLGQNSENRAR
jgi:crotonobetaine/carnitine-CoA ligase